MLLAQRFRYHVNPSRAGDDSALVEDAYHRFDRAHTSDERRRQRALEDNLAVRRVRLHRVDLVTGHRKRDDGTVPSRFVGIGDSWNRPGTTSG